MKKINLTIIIVVFVMIGNGFADEFIKITKSSIETNYTLQDEADVNDFPFNTAEIVAKYNLRLDAVPMNSNVYSMPLSGIGSDSNVFNLEEEGDANDIPFNTFEIVNYDNIDQYHFYFNDENDVDDIPFNTEEIFKSLP